MPSFLLLFLFLFLFLFVLLFLFLYLVLIYLLHFIVSVMSYSSKSRKYLSNFDRSHCNSWYIILILITPLIEFQIQTFHDYLGELRLRTRTKCTFTFSMISSLSLLFKALSISIFVLLSDWRKIYRNCKGLFLQEDFWKTAMIHSWMICERVSIKLSDCCHCFDYGYLFIVIRTYKGNHDVAYTTHPSVHMCPNSYPRTLCLSLARSLPLSLCVSLTLTTTHMYTHTHTCTNACPTPSYPQTS